MNEAARPICAAELDRKDPREIIPRAVVSRGLGEATE